MREASSEELQSICLSGNLTYQQLQNIVKRVIGACTGYIILLDLTKVDISWEYIDNKKMKSHWT